MTTVAYIANEFPSPVEPYVMDEISELRGRGINVICCSGKRVAPDALSLAERAFWKETRFFQPLTDDALMSAAGLLASDRQNLWQLLRPLLLDPGASASRRIRTLGHTLMGAAMAEELKGFKVQHIQLPSRILCFLDGTGRGPLARNWIQLHAAWLRFAPPRRSPGYEVTGVPFLLYGFRFQPSIHSEQVSFHTGRQNHRPAAGS